MKETEVAIVGAGPVGLFLGLLLARRGVAVRVLERRTAPREDSRSVGIHPVSLERFETAGVVSRFLEEGIRVVRGRVFAERRDLGSVSFASCPGRYRFVLTLPQSRSEAILEEELAAVSPGSLERGIEVTGVRPDGDRAELTWTREAKAGRLMADWVVGCDGHQSRLREWGGLSLSGGSYPDTYCMADFPDKTDFGEDACVFLGPEGLVESFPLPDRRRRWVVKTDRLIDDPVGADIATRVRARTGVDPDADAEGTVWAFGVQRRLPRSVVSGRLVLAGDAAHVIAPIGGQGMNLGWMDAWDAADALAGPPGEREERLQAYEATVMRRSIRAARRADWNLRMGRSGPGWWLRRLGASLVVHPGFSPGFARRFTMRGL